jgi:hypothetical protein
MSAASDQPVSACKTDFTFYRYYNEPAHYKPLKSLDQHSVLTAFKAGAGLTIALTQWPVLAANWTD